MKNKSKLNKNLPTFIFIHKNENEKIENLVDFERSQKDFTLVPWLLGQVDEFIKFLASFENKFDAILFDAEILDSSLGKELLSTITKNREDLILDSFFKNIKCKGASSEVESIKIVGTSLCKVPIVMVMNASFGASSNFYKTSLKYTIEGHIFYAKNILDGLVYCDQYLEIWKRRVRSRLWSVLLDNAAQALLEAKNDIELEVGSEGDKNKNVEFRLVLEDAFKYMCELLDVKYCFVRTKIDEKNYICEHSVHADWVENKKTSKIADLPMVERVIKNTEISCDKISDADCGIYKAELNGLYCQGFQLQIFGNVFGTLTVFKEEEFESDDKIFIKRLSEKIASVYGRQRIIEARKAEQEAVRLFSERAASISDERILCKVLAKIIFSCLYGKVLNDLKYHNMGGGENRKEIGEMAKVSIRIVPMGEFKLSCYAFFVNSDDKLCEKDRREIVIVNNGDPREGNKESKTQVFASAKNSNVVSCLYDKKTILYNNSDDMGNKYLITEESDFKAECNLCVPLTVKNPSGKLGVIGVINTEYIEKNFFSDDIVKFINMLAIIATTTLLKIRQNNALQSLITFIKDMARGNAEMLNKVSRIGGDQDLYSHKKNSELHIIEQLNSSMRKFIGHGVFVYFVRPPENMPIIDEAWKIKIVILDDEAKSPEEREKKMMRLSDSALQEWQKHFDKKWGETFTRKSIKSFIFDQSNQIENKENLEKSSEKIVKYTDDKNEFCKESDKLLNGMHELVSSNAVVPLYSPINNKLIGVWLFEWFNPPALNENNLSLLYDFADSVSRFENVM